MNRFFGHVHTVNTHRAEVRKLCCKCGLYWQGFTHDLSKYSPVEFFNGVKFFTGTSSPTYGERKAYGYSRAWLHHKGRNKHHGEYWQDIEGASGKTVPIVMPRKYFIEMICDRVAASKIYFKEKYTNSKPYECYMAHKDENQFHPHTPSMIAYMLKTLSEQGEEVLIQKLRELLKASD